MKKPSKPSPSVSVVSDGSSVPVGLGRSLTTLMRRSGEWKESCGRIEFRLLAIKAFSGMTDLSLPDCRRSRMLCSLALDAVEVLLNLD